MAYTKAYKEHIMYTFNGFCKVVIRYAAINAWWERSRRRQREISFEYLTEEKFYPFSTSDEAPCPATASRPKTTTAAPARDCPWLLPPASLPGSPGG